MMLSAVVDANVVIGLSKGNVFSLLPKLFQPLYVAKSVEYEVIELGRGRPGSMELQQALADGWIVSAFALGNTLPTDREAVEVAKKYRVDYILTGDLEVAKMAEEEGLGHLSTLDIVALLKLAGHIPSAASVLEVMADGGFGMSADHRQAILRITGEE